MRSSEIGLGTFSDLLVPTKNFPRPVPFSAAGVETSLCFWTDAGVVGNIGRLRVGPQSSGKLCEVQLGVQNSA